MIRGMENNIRMEEKESKWCCLPGAKVQEIMVDVKDKCKNRAEDFVVIQGGGNSLVDTGYEETAKVVIDTMKEITEKSEERHVAFVVILKRTRECINKRYDEERIRANREIQRAICKMKERRIKVSYIDMDPIINDQMYKLDGVHLNLQGSRTMATRVLTWLKQKRTPNNQEKPYVT